MDFTFLPMSPAVAVAASFFYDLGCGMGPKSPEFLELLLVPLAACVIPLRKSLERLHQRFGEQQVVKLLKSKARSVEMMI